MKLYYRQILDIINPISFYMLILSQNYLVKKTGVIFIFSFIFMPATFYILINYIYTENILTMTYKEVISGLVIGTVDFLIIYMYLNLMLRNSSYIVIFLTCIPCIGLIFPIYMSDLLLNLLSAYFLHYCAQYVAQYETSGLNYWSQRIIFEREISYSMFIFIFIIRYFLNLFLTSDISPKKMRSANVLFLLLIVSAYIFIDRSLGNMEEQLVWINIIPLSVSTISSTIWICTLGSSCSLDIYFLVYLAISIFYFVFPTTMFFQNSRIEAELYLTYLSLFILSCITYFVNQIKKVDIERIPEEYQDSSILQDPEEASQANISINFSFSNLI